MQVEDLSPWNGKLIVKRIVWSFKNTYLRIN